MIVMRDTQKLKDVDGINRGRHINDYKNWTVGNDSY